MFTIYKKEIKQIFHSVTGYIFLAAFILLSGSTFIMNNLMQANGNIQNFFSSFMTSVFLLIPMITMKTFSEEKKMKTDILLMSSPISVRDIVLGKFLSIMTVFLMGLMETIVYIFVLFYFTNSVDIPAVVGNYLGIIASASSFIAIGMLISNLTENQIIACIITYTIISFLYLFEYVQRFISSPILKFVFEQLALFQKLSILRIGIFDISILVYYISLTIFFLYLIIVLDRLRRP